MPGATKYWVYRTEGVIGCNFGKTRVGETTDTRFLDGGLHERPHLLLRRHRGRRERLPARAR